MKIAQKYKSKAITRICFVLKESDHCCLIRVIAVFTALMYNTVGTSMLTQLFHTIERQIL